MEIKITKDLYNQLLAAVEDFNKYVQKDSRENILYPLDSELYSLFKKRLGFTKHLSSKFEISVCKSDETEILSCISAAYSQLEKNKEDDYRLSGLPDPEGLTLQILKWMGIECMDQEINEAIDVSIL